MYFASDNAGPAHPKVMEALVQANKGYQPAYGADTLMAEVTAQIREIFEAPAAAVYLVANGTAANALLLATMANPWDTIFCTPMAHIHEDECNAPEFYSGAKLTLVPAENAKMTPENLRAAMGPPGPRAVHSPQHGPVSLTQVTEKGTVYSIAELKALTEIAHAYGLTVHMDGARFANALVSLGCTPAEMTWKAGIDTVSLGGTKNGLLGVEACVIFNPDIAREFALRRKRGGHLFSKNRYLAAQMQAYLTQDLWCEMARMANARTAQLAAGLAQDPAAEMLYTPQANIIFVRLPRRDHQRLQAAGAVYYVMDGDVATGDPADLLAARLVTDWSATPESIDAFLNALRS